MMKNTGKIAVLGLLIIGLVLILTTCGCEHDWADATCLAPKTCNLCGATSGDIAEHNYMEANCENPRRCSFCDATEGKALGHDYVDGYCTTCYQKDPSYIDLNSFGFKTRHGMDALIEISGYNLKENYVELYNTSNIYILHDYYQEDIRVVFDKINNLNRFDVYDSSAYCSYEKQQCNFDSNNSGTHTDSDGFWIRYSIIDRIVDSNNEKLIIKILDDDYGEIWFAPYELLDFNTITKVDGNKFQVKFK